MVLSILWMIVTMPQSNQETNISLHRMHRKGASDFFVIIWKIPKFFISLQMETIID